MSVKSPNIKSDQQLIGTAMRKVEGLDKSTGRAVYTDDLAFPGMLHGKILRSPYPHARIVSIEVRRAEALPGVHGVITGRDMPTTYGVIPWTPDEYPLCVDRVRYIGDGVAAVAAVDEDTALRALELIDVEYEELPAFMDPHEAAEADGSTPYVHEASKPGWNGNITKMVHLEFGDVDALMDSSDVVVEDEYFFEGTTHAAIEPHCAIGSWDGVGQLTVWSATQVPHYLHRELSRVLGVTPAQVRVLQPLVGGAFGGKSEPFDLECCVANLSKITGRPVKILYTREEVFYAHRGRHPFHMKYRTGATKDGKLTSVDAKILLDGGFHSCVHEQTGMRAEAGSRIGSATLRVRSTDGQVGREGRPGSDRVSAPQFHRRKYPDHQRTSSDVQRISGVSRGGGASERMVRQVSQDALRQGPRHCRLDVHLRNELPHLS